MSVRFAGAFVAAVTLGLAASAHAQPGLATRGAEGLGLIGPEIPDELKQAQADPYAPPADPVCATVPAEIAKLDALLGPDINPPKPKAFVPTDMVGHAVRSAIPYRSAIRFITGADRKEKARQQASMAGWARRGFLKGLAAKYDCRSPTEAAAAEPAKLDLPPAVVQAASVGPVAVPATPAPQATPELRLILPPASARVADASPVSPQDGASPAAPLQVAVQAAPPQDR